MFDSVSHCTRAHHPGIYLPVSVFPVPRWNYEQAHHAQPFKQVLEMGAQPLTHAQQAVHQLSPRPRHLLLCFGAVGEVHHHAAGEACPRGLGCDQLQLRGAREQMEGWEGQTEVLSPHWSESKARSS